MEAGIYLHIPFCRSKCTYCDFFSLSADEYEISNTVESLNREIGLHKGNHNYRVSTIYFGGGTPTAINVYHIEMLMSSILGSFECSEMKEITIECNPDTADQKKLTLMRRNGFNRISIGFQSLNNSSLILLGRRHDARTAADSFRAAADAGFNNISVDLIYGIPGENTRDFLRSLEEVILLGPENISLYHLTSKSDTQLSRMITGNILKMPSDEMVSEQYYSASHMLDACGYVCYEVSNFALPGYECRHNLNYWRRGHYIGIGPSACSFDGRTRSKNISNLSFYRDAVNRGLLPIEYKEHLSNKEKIYEEIFLSLRTAEGIDLREIENESIVDIEKLNYTINYLSENGYIDKNHSKITVKDKFRLITDSLTIEILDSIKC